MIIKGFFKILECGELNVSSAVLTLFSCSDTCDRLFCVSTNDIFGTMVFLYIDILPFVGNNVFLCSIAKTIAGTDC
jgi:hypothetical protein